MKKSIRTLALILGVCLCAYPLVASILDQREQRLKNKSIVQPKNKIKKAFWIACMVSLQAILFCQPVLAAPDGAAIVTNGLSALTDIIKAFVSSVGTMVVLWGLFEWGNSMQSHDGMMQSSAFKRIGGGLIMTLGPQLLEIFV